MKNSLEILLLSVKEKDMEKELESILKQMKNQPIQVLKKTRNLLHSEYKRKAYL